MIQHVGAIFTRRGPSQMLRVHTPLISLPAAVSRLMRWAWCWTVNKFTHETRYGNCASVSIHVRPCIAREWERPNKAIFRSAWQNYAIKECSLPILRSNFTNWRSIPPNPLVMHVTKTGRFNLHGLAAIWDEAYQAVSHSAVLSRWGQGRALFHQRFRPDFLNRFTIRSQGLAPC